MPIDGVWNGVASGAYNGTLTLDLKSEDRRVTGEIVLVEAGVGETAAKVSGELSDQGHLSATLDSFVSNIPTQQIELPRSGQIEGQYHADQEFIDGAWKTDLGTSGRFTVIRAVAQVTSRPARTPVPAQPLQRVPPLHNRTDALGSYRLDHDDLIGLADVVRSGTNVLLAAVNITSEGRGFIHVGMDSVLADHTLPDVVYEMFVSANEAIIKVGHKIVALTFKKNGPNILFVSDYDRTWVEGKASEIIQFLRGRESKAARFLSKYGPFINSVIFLALLGFLPSIPVLKQRFEILAVVFGLLMVLLYSWRLAVSFKAYLRDKKIPWYRRYESLWLTFVTILLTAIASYLIARYTPR